MWISFNLNDMLFKLKIDKYKLNHSDNEYVEMSYEYSFKNIINYKKDNQKVLLCKDIDNLKDIIKSLLDKTLKSDDTYYCYEPDFSFDFISGKWLKITTYLWNNDNRIGKITNNEISITLELKEIEQLYLYLKLITNEIDINNNDIKKLLKNNILIKKQD